MLALRLIRHGQTDWNVQSRFQGQVDVPLNALGQAQAQRLAMRLKVEPAEPLVVSDLLRTRQTAQAIEPIWSVQAQPSASWREQSFGILEGLVAQDIERQYPQEWRQWLSYRSDYVPPGGESFQMLDARIRQAVREVVSLCEKMKLPSCTVVTHGAVLDVIWRWVHGLDLEGPRKCPIPNVGLNTVRTDGEVMELVQWADDAHVR
jgi:probable phosphoglycerate mutase